MSANCNKKKTTTNSAREAPDSDHDQSSPAATGSDDDDHDDSLTFRPAVDDREKLTAFLRKVVDKYNAQQELNGASELATDGCCDHHFEEGDEEESRVESTPRHQSKISNVTHVKPTNSRPLGSSKRKGATSHAPKQFQRLEANNLNIKPKESTIHRSKRQKEIHSDTTPAKPAAHHLAEPQQPKESQKKKRARKIQGADLRKAVSREINANETKVMKASLPLPKRKRTKSLQQPSPQQAKLSSKAKAPIGPAAAVTVKSPQPAAAKPRGKSPPLPAAKSTAKTPSPAAGKRSTSKSPPPAVSASANSQSPPVAKASAKSLPPLAATNSKAKSTAKAPPPRAASTAASAKASGSGRPTKRKHKPPKSWSPAVTADRNSTLEELSKEFIERTRARTNLDILAPDPEEESPPDETEDERRRRRERINGRRKRARKFIEIEQMNLHVVDLRQRNEALQEENIAFRERLKLVKGILAEGGKLTAELLCLPENKADEPFDAIGPRARARAGNSNDESTEDDNDRKPPAKVRPISGSSRLDPIGEQALTSLNLSNLNPSNLRPSHPLLTSQSLLQEHLFRNQAQLLAADSEQGLLRHVLVDTATGSNQLPDLSHLQLPTHNLSMPTHNLSMPTQQADVASILTALLRKQQSQQAEAPTNRVVQGSLPPVLNDALLNQNPQRQQQQQHQHPQHQRLPPAANFQHLAPLNVSELAADLLQHQQLQQQQQQQQQRPETDLATHPYDERRLSPVELYVRLLQEQKEQDQPAPRQRQPQQQQRHQHQHQQHSQQQLLQQHQLLQQQEQLLQHQHQQQQLLQLLQLQRDLKTQYSGPFGPCTQRELDR